MTRLALLTDGPRLFELWCQLRKYENSLGDASYFHQEPVYDLVAWSASMSIAMASPNIRLVVAECSGQVAGFVLASVEDRYFTVHRRVLRVHEMFVEPNSRAGAKAARELRQFLKQFAASEGATATELECVPGNCQRWLRKGFKEYKRSLWREIK